MKFVIILGPQAVGKMTVGQELAKETGLKLFHNHMTIELPMEFFPHQHPERKRLTELFRREVFKSVASSELKGLIFTIVWAFNKDDWGYIEEISKIFTDQGGEIYLIELEAHLDERLKRNTTENRLLHKPSKRTIADSEGRIRKSSEEYRLNSMPGEITNKNYIRIDNTNLSAEEVARKIHTAFDL